MPITYKILDNSEYIGDCHGLPSSDTQGKYILFQPEMYGLVSAGNTLVTPENNYLELYFEDPVVKNGQLVALKLYYR